MIAVDRYQTGPDAPGTMPTAEWFRALRNHIDGPLGSVLDVGCAEGVMCLLAATQGATSVLGIGLHDDRMAAAMEAVRGYPQIEIREQEARDFAGEFDTVIFSMMAHWLGQEETRRFAGLARRNFGIVFRAWNEHYSVPENGTWFPTLAELDATIVGVRTSETLLLTQDHGKEVWAATYRTDLRVVDGWVLKPAQQPQPVRRGRDLHGDPPFRPTNGAGLAELTPDEKVAVRDLVAAIAWKALVTGYYPTDLSPRNIIVGPEGAFLIEDAEPHTTMGQVEPEYLPIWQRTLSTIGLEFAGDLRELL